MKKLKLPLIAVSIIVAVGAAYAKKTHSGIQGNLLICVSGVCEISPYSDNDELGGVQVDPQIQFYKGNIGWPCNSVPCSIVYPPQVWLTD